LIVPTPEDCLSKSYLRNKGRLHKQTRKEIRDAEKHVIKRMMLASTGTDRLFTSPLADSANHIEGTAAQSPIPCPEFPSQKAFTNILIGIRESFGFEAGIIYIADYGTNTLRCSAYIDSEHVPIDFTRFSYRFDEPS